MSRLLFLPGVTGDPGFWQPVASRLPDWHSRCLGWPGFGPVPADPRIRQLSDLTELVRAELDSPAVLIAQSMGGLIALDAALARPESVKALVLVATSGGLDMQALGAQDWRAGFASKLPLTPDWFSRERRDRQRDFQRLSLPVLLLWADADPLSPLAVAERLQQLLPQAQLEILPGGHDLAWRQPEAVARVLKGWLEEAIGPRSLG